MIKKVIFSKLFILFFTIANIYFLLSNLPFLILSSKTPSGSVFPLYHSSAIYDYNVYLSVITLGQNGYLFNRDAFTSEATKPGIFYIFYIIVGKLSGFFHMWPPIAYHLTRIIGIEMFLLAVYFLTYMILGKKVGFWASIFSIVATISPVWLFGEKGALTDYIPWWKDMEALGRLNSLPHHIMGQALFLISLIFILQFIRLRQKKYIFFSAISLFIQGIILPPSILPITLGIPATCLIMILIKREEFCGEAMLFEHAHGPEHHESRGARGVERIWEVRKKDMADLSKILIGLSIIFLFSLIPLLISKWQTSQGYPWSAWVTWETQKWNLNEPNFNRDLFLSFGILPIFSLLSVWQKARTRNWKGIFTVFWAVCPFLLLPFVNIMGIGKIRLISSAPFVPFAILAALSIFEVVKKKSLRIILVLIFLFANLSVTFVLLRQDIQTSLTQYPYANLFISGHDMKTIDFIKENIPKDSIILSNEFIGNIIPAYAPVISYFGHINQTMDFVVKQNNVRKFYSGEFSGTQAYDFVRTNHISYVYFGGGEKMLGPGTLNYNFINPYFKEGDITLYQVKI